MPCNTKVYRGQEGWFVKLPQNGEEDTLGAFFSTSHDLTTSERFAEIGNPPVIYTLDCPKNSNAMFIGDRGSVGGESEIIFTPDQKIRYTDVFMDDDGVLNVHAKLIDNSDFNLEEWFDNLGKYDVDW